MVVPAIVDLPTLKLNLDDYLARNDLGDYYPTFIELAEKRLNSSLKTLGMQGATDLAIANGAQSVNLPNDYVEWVRVVFTAGGRSLGLRYMEPNAPEVTHRFRPNGPPQFYTVTGGVLSPVPARDGTYRLTYYQRLPPLTDGAPTNWLIVTAPQIYLYATLAEAYAFQKDEDKAAIWAKTTEDRLAAFVAESSSGKVGRRAERAAELEAEAIAAKAMS